jgi:hypothetical protein
MMGFAKSSTHPTAATAPKEQGRERSMTQAALPAPDIEIGSRRPVNYILPGNLAGKCDPLHKGREKFRSWLHAADSDPGPDGPPSRVGRIGQVMMCAGEGGAGTRAYLCSGASSRR